LKKLGIKPGFTVWFVDVPEGYVDWLGPLPEGVEVTAGPRPGSCDFVHFFTTSRAALVARLPQLKAALAKDGMLWLSWPKKASGVATDLDGNGVRELGLAQGLVDVKVAAIDTVWSGLKFVYRLQDR
jgi:hypothetical protein